MQKAGGGEASDSQGSPRQHTPSKRDRGAQQETEAEQEVVQEESQLRLLAVQTSAMIYSWAEVQGTFVSAGPVGR